MNNDRINELLLSIDDETGINLLSAAEQAELEQLQAMDQANSQ